MVVAGDHLVEPVRITSADVPQVAGQLESQRVAVALYGLLALVVQLPVLLQDLRKRNPVVVLRIGLFF